MLKKYFTLSITDRGGFPNIFTGRLSALYNLCRCKYLRLFQRVPVWTWISHRKEKAPPEERSWIWKVWLELVLKHYQRQTLTRRRYGDHKGPLNSVPEGRAGAKKSSRLPNLKDGELASKEKGLETCWTWTTPPSRDISALSCSTSSWPPDQLRLPGTEESTNPWDMSHLNWLRIDWLRIEWLRVNWPPYDSPNPSFATHTLAEGRVTHLFKTNLSLIGQAAWCHSFTTVAQLSSMKLTEQTHKQYSRSSEKSVVMYVGMDVLWKYMKE